MCHVSQKLDTSLWKIFLSGPEKEREGSTKGKLISWELHNTGSCTRTRVARYRAMQNGTHVLISSGGSRGAELPLVTRKLPMQQHAKHRYLHNIGSCTTHGVADYRKFHNSEVAQHKALHNGSQVLISSRGSAGSGGRTPSPPSHPQIAYAATCTTQGVTKHRKLHNTRRCTMVLNI